MFEYTFDTMDVFGINEVVVKAENPSQAKNRASRATGLKVEDLTIKKVIEIYG